MPIAVTVVVVVAAVVLLSMSLTHICFRPSLDPFFVFLRLHDDNVISSSS